MKRLGPRFGSRVVGTLLVLATASGAAAQAPRNADLADADKTIEGLRQITRELLDAVKKFHSDLDEAIAKYDRGYRTIDKREVLAADSDLIGGPADIVQETMRKFAAFRMLAARSERPDPPPVLDMDRLQNLIEEEHRRVQASGAALRRLLVISAKDFDPRQDAERRNLHDQLLKARAGAEDASKQAWLALPIDLPRAESSGESAQKAWEVLSRGWPAGAPGDGATPPDSEVQKDSRTQAIPIRIERRRRVTLVSNPSYRMALTDSGIEDEVGRRLFYQEEWIQRGTAVIRNRWRVAVDTATGDHVLIKRYPALELRGGLDELYPQMDRYSVWYLEPAGGNRPAIEDAEAALSDLESSRIVLREAMNEFQSATRVSLAKQDRKLAADMMPVLDAGLAPAMREALFAIRAHLAGVAANVEAENHAWNAVTQAGQRIAQLEAVAAWANRVSEAEPAGGAWEQILERAERAIDVIRAAENEAAAMLPPNNTEAEARFPALQKGVIVRIRRPSVQKSPGGLILCRQEIWHMESPMTGLHEVRRTATLVAIDPRTGAQTAAGGRTKYYSADSGEALENVFDEHAADDLPIALFDTRTGS